MPFFGYDLSSEMSMIIIWGKPGWESHILYNDYIKELNKLKITFMLSVNILEQ